MKRTWVFGSLVLLLFAAVGIAIAQTPTQNVRQQVFQAWEDVLGISSSPTSPQEATVQQDTSATETEQMDAVTCCPTASSANHSDLVLPSYLQFVDDGNICANSSLCISSQTHIDIHSEDDTSMDAHVVYIDPTDAFEVRLQDQAPGGHQFLDVYFNGDTRAASVVDLFAAVTPLGQFFVGHHNLTEGVYLGSSGANDGAPDGILRLTSGYIDEEENVVEPMAQLRVENDDQEVTAHVTLTNDGDSGTAEMGNEKASIAVEPTGSVTIRLGPSPE